MGVKKHINIKLIITLLCVLFFNMQVTLGQDKSYPVLANLMLNYPNRIYLSDYASPINPGMNIGLLLKDMDQAGPVQVKLKISITGQGSKSISIFTNKDRLDYLPSIELYPGTYHQVGPDILSAYLDPKNLEIHGPGNSLYESNGGRLPEGPYIFTVEAYETRRGPKVSNTAQIFAVLALNEAPRWVSPWMLPKDDIMMQPVMPQLIYFSWMSQHNVSMVTETEYEIVIAEVLEEMDYHEALDLSIPNPLRSVYTSPSTFLMYDASYPFLEIGKTYACQIQAKDRQGRALFKMGGKSDILVFKYGEPCPDLNAHNVEVISSWEVNFDWNKDPAHTIVELKYREQNDDGTFSSWYYDQSEQNDITLSTLNAGKTYEYELTGKCQSIYSEPLSGTFTTEENSDPPPKTCGEESGFNAPTNQNPCKSDINKGTIIHAGGFDVVVSDVSSFSAGTLSGEGVIKLATFGLNFKCTFDDIFINEEMEVTSGEVQVVINPDGGGVMDLDETFNITNDLIVSEAEILEDVNKYLGEVESDIATLETRSSITEATKNNLNIVKGNLGSLLEKNNNGQISLEPEQEQKIQEALEGIDRNLNKEKVKVKDDLTDTEIRVYFKETKNQLYGFDAKEYDAHKDNYEKLEFKEEDYYVSWKSVKSNGSDQVSVEIELGGENISADDIKFVNSKGLVLPVAPASGSSQDGIHKTLTINGVNTEQLLSADAYHINAIYTEKDDNGKEISKTVGKLSIQTYPDKDIKVILVPVGKGASAPSVDLNKIFKQAVMNVTAQVQTTKQVIVSDWDDKNDFVFDNGETGFLANYTDHMNKVIDAYTNTYPDYDKDAYYIFVLNYDCTNSTTTGYMPRQRRFGFLFSNTDILNTAAHELAHGAFNLGHTWLDYPELSQGSTKNLMDYGGGSILRKYQWDLIHHPRLIIPWLQDDEGAKAYGQPGSEYVCIKDGATLGEINNYKQFYLPNGKVIDLEGKYNASGFFTSEDVTLPGAIYSIRIDGVDYLHAYKPGTQTTLGFSTPDKSKSIKIGSFKTMESSDQAVKVLVNGETINVKSSGTVKQISFDGICECLEPADNEFEDIYFATSNTSEPYIDYFTSNSKQINHSIADETGIVDGLVKIALAEKSKSTKDAALLGEELADKLSTYELLNPGRKFIIAPLLVETLSANQDSWQAIAQKVFQQANLSVNDILVTIPYVHCSGIGFDLGEYYFMPGLAVGRNITINLTGLGSDYSNTHNVASFIVDNTRSSLWEYIKDIFKNTQKKYIKRYYYITAKGDITGRIGETEGHAGFPGTIDFRLVVDGRFKKYGDLLSRINNNVFLDSKNLANKSQHLIDAFYKLRDELENQYDNFLVTNPDPEDFIVNHGMKESGCLTNESVCDQFVLWYRDYVYATTEEQASPSDGCFFLGKNQVVYDATLEQIEAFGIILAPFNFDWVADGIGFFYSGYYCDFSNMSIYGANFFIPVVTTGVIKGSTKALLNGLRTGESEIVEEGGEYIIRWIAKDTPTGIPDELMEAYKIALNAPDAIRRNTDVLETVTRLSKKTLSNKKALDVKKLFDNGFGKTLENVSDAQRTHILNRIENWSPDFVDDLARRLGKDKYPNLADDLIDPDFFKLYDDIIHDPYNAVDIAKHAGDGNLTTTAKSTFFQEVTSLGKQFEDDMLKAVLDKSSNTYQELSKKIPDLADRKVLSQVHFCVPGKSVPCNAKGEYFIADQVLVKFDSRGRVVDMVVVDSKLSKATNLTDGQTLAKNGVGGNLMVRSQEILKDVNEAYLPSAISQKTTIKNSGFYKIYGDGKGNFSGIE